MNKLEKIGGRILFLMLVWLGSRVFKFVGFWTPEKDGVVKGMILSNEERFIKQYLRAKRVEKLRVPGIVF